MRNCCQLRDNRSYSLHDMFTSHVCIVGVGALDRITFGYNWIVSGSFTKPMVCTWRVHLPSPIQDLIGNNNGLFFALTTPIGVGIGTGIASVYNPYSPGALIAEGILDSLSAGVLVYMALVDLIAADFLSRSMSCNFRLQIASYCMLFLVAGLISSLAI
ncbi:hypothetical protein TSUD_315380 [Trifolium subterraneum]|uniref:Zinc/iron permease n=1 Tax=Trifolium subterraneum TaxID=3900 RepID=A0A2Z6MHA7_TRISU|nr:hypothetical protein TSUD_315380 [Trifolium subterraneum]